MTLAIRKILIVLFTVGILVGVAILAVDSLSATSGVQVISDQNMEAAQIQQQVQTESEDGNSTDNVVISLASKMGVVALIIMLVFFVQMGIAWMLRKPVQAVRW